MALVQGGLENQIFVWVHRPLHHRLPQAVGGGEQHRIAEAALGVDREHHPRCGQVGAHHPLHANGQGHIAVIEAMDLPVGDRPIGEQGAVAAAAGGDQVGVAAHIEKGFLLAGEAGIGQILRRGAGAHGHRRRRLARLGGQLVVGSQDRRFQIRRQWIGQQQRAGSRPRRPQGPQVGAVQAVQQLLQALAQLAAGDQLAIGECGGGKSPGNPHPLGRQLPDHLPQGGVLAAHLGDRLDTHRLQGHHQWRRLPWLLLAAGSFLHAHAHGDGDRWLESVQAGAQAVAAGASRPKPGASSLQSGARLYGGQRCHSGGFAPISPLCFAPPCSLWPPRPWHW